MAVRRGNGKVVIWSGEDAPRNMLAPRLLAMCKDNPALSEAKYFLRDVLADGAVEAREVKRMAGEICIAEITLKRAKASLGILTRRDGFGKNGGFAWEFPIANCKDDGNYRRGSSFAEIPESP
jgi:hypothetical protein